MSVAELTLAAASLSLRLDEVLKTEFERRRRCQLNLVFAQRIPRLGLRRVFEFNLAATLAKECQPEIVGVTFLGTHCVIRWTLPASEDVVWSCTAAPASSDIWHISAPSLRVPSLVMRITCADRSTYQTLLVRLTQQR
jgi:hypothetical protein